MNPMFIPTTGYIEFLPTVTSPHGATANRLDCTLETPDRLECNMQPREDRQVVFDNDPAQYFRVGPGVGLDAALDVLRAFRDGVVEDPNEDKQELIAHLPLRSIDIIGNYYSVTFSDCGCAFETIVDRRSVGTQWKVTVIRAPSGTCV